MQAITDNQLLDQLKNEDSASFELLYRFYYPSIAGHIIRNQGRTEDAEDVFQEAIIVLLHKVRQPGFGLTSSLKTYLFAIARNLWLKRLRDRKSVAMDAIGQYGNQSDVTDFDQPDAPSPEEKVADWLTRITENCQRILRAIFLVGEPIESLMQKMGWKNKHTAANQQYKCIQQVKREKEKEQKA